MVDWWAYGLEMFLAVSEQDIREIPKTIGIGDNDVLHITIDGKPQTFYDYCRRGHLRKMCLLKINLEEKVIKELGKSFGEV